MPQIKKTPLGNNPTGKAPDSKAVTRDRKGRRTAFIIASVVIVLILVIVVVSYFFSEDARHNRLTIIEVDDISINMDYFLKRTRLDGRSPMEMLGELTNEQVIKIAAPQYVGEVTPEDIDQTLRGMAGGESETISESEFKEWYRQLLNEIDLSDSEYRDYIGTLLLRFRLHEYLAERVPTVVEQVHLHTALLSIEETGKIWEKVDEGEDLNELISEMWQDYQSEGTIDDLGWLPRGVLPYGFDEVVFSLTIGDVSEPLAYMSDDPMSDEIFYYLLMVSEKADAREVDEGPLQILKDDVLDEWLLAESKLHKITWNYNSEIDSWINWQLAKE